MSVAVENTVEGGGLIIYGGGRIGGSRLIIAAAAGIKNPILLDGLLECFGGFYRKCSVAADGSPGSQRWGFLPIFRRRDVIDSNVLVELKMLSRKTLTVAYAIGKQRQIFGGIDQIGLTLRTVAGKAFRYAAAPNRGLRIDRRGRYSACKYREK